MPDILWLDLPNLVASAVSRRGNQPLPPPEVEVEVEAEVASSGSLSLRNLARINILFIVSSVYRPDYALCIDPTMYCV